LLGGGIVLRKNGHCQNHSEQQREDDSVIHFQLPPSGEWGAIPSAFTARFFIAPLNQFQNFGDNKRRDSCLNKLPQKARLKAARSCGAAPL
jgi:hypothetical protein